MPVVEHCGRVIWSLCKVNSEWQSVDTYVYFHPRFPETELYLILNNGVTPTCLPHTGRILLRSLLVVSLLCSALLCACLLCCLFFWFFFWIIYSIILPPEVYRYNHTRLLCSLWAIAPPARSALLNRGAHARGGGGSFRSWQRPSLFFWPSPPLVSFYFEKQVV